MEKKEIAELFMKGIDCSQVVVGAFAEELGITKEDVKGILGKLVDLARSILN